MKNKITHVIGIDEAGRGPLAGPVAVGVVVVQKSFDWRLLLGVKDSKKLSERKRKEIFGRARVLKKEKKIDFVVTLVGAKSIDRIGITEAVSIGIQRTLKRLNVNPKNVEVRLDGLLVAPPTFLKQKTITGGDSKEKVIGLASILAKVTRDAYMVRIAGDFPQYQFEIHKGYGTRVHREKIKQHGLSPVHRVSFCTKLEYPQ